MKVTIRLDDITPDMDWGKFRLFEKVLDELGVCPIVGVVPDCKDETLHVNDPYPQFWDEVRRLQDKKWIVALHGYNHIYTIRKGGLFPLNLFSEFAGVPYDIQFDKIKKGKEILESNGVRTGIFMAPGHTFDKNTVCILKELGFKAITDGFGNRPYERDGLIFYPIAEKRSAVFNDSREGRTTLVYHLNTMTEEAINKEKELLLTNKDKLISFEEIDSAPKQTLFERINELIKANAKRILVSIRQ